MHTCNLNYTWKHPGFSPTLNALQVSQPMCHNCSSRGGPSANRWKMDSQLSSWNLTTTRTLSRLTDFIFAAENVGEMTCLAFFHVSPLACASPRGVFRFQPKMFGKCCSKEDVAGTHSQQIFMSNLQMQTNYIHIQWQIKKFRKVGSARTRKFLGCHAHCTLETFTYLCT